MRKYCVILLLLLPTILIAQKQDITVEERVYGYSFVADIDSALVTSIADQVAQLDGITKTKGFYKKEKGEGFIMIYVNYEEIIGREDLKDPFNVADLKNLLIRNNLEPKDLRRIK